MPIYYSKIGKFKILGVTMSINTDNMNQDELDLWSDINNPNNDADMDDWSDAHNPNNDNYIEDDEDD
jgi:hypothetical protein